MPPVWPGVFGRIGAALAESLRVLRFHVEVEASAQARLNIVLGWSVFVPRIPNGASYVVLQHEPLRHEPWPDRFGLSADLFAGALKRWDYSEDNLGLSSRGAERWFPLRRSPIARAEGTVASPSWDVLFAGVLTPRRDELVRELSQHCCVSARLRWGSDLDETLPRTKIVLNVHGGDPATPLEQPRVWQALERGCFVLSEESIDEPYAALTTAPYERLPEVALELLHDSARRERLRVKALEAFRRGPSMVETLADALAELSIEPPSTSTNGHPPAPPSWAGTASRPRRARGCRRRLRDSDGRGARLRRRPARAGSTAPSARTFCRCSGVSSAGPPKRES